MSNTSTILPAADFKALETVDFQQTLPKFEKPSLIIKNALNKMQRDIIKNVAKSLEITEDEAQALLKDNQAFNELLDMVEKNAKLDMIINIIPKILKAAETKIESGSLEQMKHAITAWAIARDKVHGGDQRTSGLMIGGNNVNINLKGWNFKPYGKK